MTVKVFSPSSTVTFSQCPRKWAFEQAGVKSQVIEYPELAGILGNGFAKVMEVYNKGLMRGVTYPMSELTNVGCIEMDEELAHQIGAGRRIASEKDQEKADKLPAMLEKAVNLYYNWWKVNFSKAVILQAEHTYPEHGNARLDLVADTGTGPELYDYKVKWNLESKWEAKELEKHAKGWQRSHYTWMTGLKKFNIILVVLGPKPYIKVEPYQAGEYDEHTWQYDAQHLWHRMQTLTDMHTEPFMYPGAAKHEDEYGACLYQSACLDYALDPQRMAVKYIQVERRKK